MSSNESELRRWFNMPAEVTTSFLGPKGYKKLKEANKEPDPDEYSRFGARGSELER